MMEPAWPERIVCRQAGAPLDNAGKTAAIAKSMEIGFVEVPASCFTGALR
jgi:hypothetical protein